MKLTNVGKGLKVFAGKTGLKMKKYSPELLIAGGIIGFGGTVVLACRATLKCQEVMAEHEEKMRKIEECKEKFTEEEETYSDEDYKKDITVVKTQTAVNVTRLYFPVVTLGVASVVCFLGAHNIMKKRNIAIIAAYKAVEEGFAEYRQRVKDELGEEKDFHFRYGTEEVEEIEEVVDEDGKKKKVKKTVQKFKDGTKVSEYARLFEPSEGLAYGNNNWTGSTQFSPVHAYNYSFLMGKQNWLNDMLNARGYLFLNEAYEELGFPKTKAGQVVGWVKGANGIDNYVSLGPAIDYLAYKDGDPILVDFNVDGVILDLIEQQ